MTETFRTEAELLTALADNEIGSITEQTIRDVVYSLIRKSFWDATVQDEDPAHLYGRVFVKDGTLNFMRDVAGVVANLPDEVQTPKGRNATGGVIANGRVVWVNGAQGSRPKFALASKSDASAYRALAVATHDIADNSDGYATTFGVVRGLDTTGPGAETWSEGDEIFLAENGELTNVEPSWPDAVVSIGVVLYAHASDGMILVYIRRERTAFLQAGLAEARPLASSSTYSNLHVWSWDDLTFQALDADRKQDQLIVEAYRDTGQVKTFAERNGTTKLSFDFQQRHRWAGTAVYLHVHMIPCGVSAGDVGIEGAYHFAGAGDEIPALSGWTTFSKSIAVAAEDQWHRLYKAVATCAPPAEPGSSDTLSVVVSRVPDTYVGNKNDGGTLAANVCIESFDVHYQSLLLGSEEEFSGAVSLNPTRLHLSSRDAPGGGRVYLQILARSDGGEPVSFRLYNVTDGAVAQLTTGGDAEVAGVTDSEYSWHTIGPLALTATTKEYRIQAKYDSAASEPWVAHARIMIR